MLIWLVTTCKCGILVYFVSNLFKKKLLWLYVCFFLNIFLCLKRKYHIIVLFRIFFLKKQKKYILTKKKKEKINPGSKRRIIFFSPNFFLPTLFFLKNQSSQFFILLHVAKTPNYSDNCEFAYSNFRMYKVRLKNILSILFE